MQYLWIFIIKITSFSAPKFLPFACVVFANFQFQYCRKFFRQKFENSIFTEKSQIFRRLSPASRAKIWIFQILAIFDLEFAQIWDLAQNADPHRPSPQVRPRSEHKKSRV